MMISHLPMDVTQDDRRNLECRLVHHAQDKCAFVRANCPDEEAGIFSYLTLYYCRTPKAQPVAFAIMVLWLGLLFSTIGIAASDFFCVNLGTISNLLGMSESMAGVTFLAFGNGSPDVFSTFAAMSTNSGSLAVGELFGAAGFITAVVAGSMALVRPFQVAKKSFVRDVGFFIVAASFSIVFLHDGKLFLWECLAMVAFYIFYVVFVVIWHWWLGRQRRRRQKIAAARGNYVAPGNEEVEFEEEYRDDDEDGAAGGSTRASSRRVSVADFSALERGGDELFPNMDLDQEDDTRERWMGELSSNMRLSRPRLGHRRTTANPIRPSLVGALEFRAVLSSLQKSRNIQTMPMNLRRYSDDLNYTSAQQQDHMSSVSDPAARPPYDLPQSGDASLSLARPNADVRAAGGSRLRAVSTNDIDRVRMEPDNLRPDAVPRIDLLGPLPEDNGSLRPPLSDGIRTTRSSISLAAPPSPSLTVSPPPSEPGSRAPSPPPIGRSRSADRLELPDANAFRFQNRQQSTLTPESGVSPNQTAPQSPQVRPLPKLEIPASAKGFGSSPSSPFPKFVDFPTPSRSRAASLRLPPASISPESSYNFRDYVDTEIPEPKPLSWWPYKILPPPGVLISTLFPTLYTWKDKNIWEKFLGVVAAPSVLLLTITLPVVEGEKDDDDEEQERIPDLSLSSSLVTTDNGVKRTGASTVTILEPDSPDIVKPAPHPSGDRSSGSAQPHDLTGHGNTAAVATHAEHHHRDAFHSNAAPATPSAPHILQSPEALPHTDIKPTAPKDWNRWLVILQVFTAPFFIVLIVWANSEPESPRALIRPTIYSLLASLVTLALILSTTSPTRPPRWRVLLCFLGFVVSISWISTIANEVVGVLKTLGVVLNMSDAILGLTIFAVGNSLGDLVADITVARLGYPVMALSACFGGPMLNILLGIGISGSYMSIKGAEKREHRHPGTPMKFKPYHIDVSSTLLISGATLLVTLVGLLVLVPFRKWKMDRWIGCFLICLWTVSTIGNVVVEVLGYGGHIDLFRHL
ncbi:hypothetical protein H2199_003177 [Coniosporium tulheliwenetii]|uniref:Uncharacterized protein n=1 Tax=Coniosporium tulheliwenetii TaxID=3383036 RepID=A0ACC2ZBL8_9PEZI|nr:hypothetical protein H2199_003177 [Cladosporium sp. JES 115]